MFSTAAKARAPFDRIGHVGVEQREVELDVQRFFIQLARQVHARFGRVDVLVEIQHQVVGDDRITGREERDQALDHVALGVASPCCAGRRRRWRSRPLRRSRCS